jgi:aspartate aminotransferase-like enzyme
MPNKEMLLIPGPTPVVDEIYDALASETYSHTDPRVVKTTLDSLEMTRQMFNTDGEVFIVAGSGTLAMEMAIVNTVAPGEKILVLSQGFFGDRFIKLAESFGIVVEVVSSEWGKRVSPEAVEAKLRDGVFKAVTVTHVDTSTGVEADLETLVPLVKKHGALFILDGVCATAAVPEDMGKAYACHECKIDVVLTGSQKAIGVPPGLAIVAFGPKALAARAELSKITAYYADIYNWLPIMKDPGKYFATPAVNMLYAYRRAMQLIMEEGLEKRYARHRKWGSAVRTALGTYGLKALAAEEVAAPTLTCFLYPQGVEDAAFRKSLAAKGMVVAGALAALAGKAFRLGHMGNVTREQLHSAIGLIGEALAEQGVTVDIKAAQEVFDSLTV